MSRVGASRIGFVSARPGYADESGVFTDAGLGRLVDRLAASCGEFELALAAAPNRGAMQEHRLGVATERFTPLPEMASLARGFWKAGACRKTIAELESRTDALIVQLPFAAPLALTRPGGPRLYHVCADILQQAKSAQGYAGAKRAPALAVGGFIDRLHRSLIRGPRSRAVTHGEHLHRHYGGRGRAVVSSTLVDEEILSVERTRPVDSPFRILFVGYLRHEKGIDTLLDAFVRVRREIDAAELVIVGGRDLVDTGVEAQLADMAPEIRSAVDLVGAVPFGRELFQHFADADVLVLPSRSEGTPRVLVEARAFGCPVIASRIGGIPTSVHDGVDGLLFPVGDAEALTDEIRTLATDRELHRRLVGNGIERARRTTVDRFAEELLEELETLLDECHRGAVGGIGR